MSKFLTSATDWVKLKSALFPQLLQLSHLTDWLCRWTISCNIELATLQGEHFRTTFFPTHIWFCLRSHIDHSFFFSEEDKAGSFNFVNQFLKSFDFWLLRIMLCIFLKTDCNFESKSTYFSFAHFFLKGGNLPAWFFSICLTKLYIYYLPLLTFRYGIVNK